VERKCSIYGCEKPHVARGYCESHYRRLKRHGDPRGKAWWSELTPEERFWTKTDRRTKNECWPWTGSRRGRKPHQYGCVWDGTYRPNGSPNQIGAHRFAYELLIGPVPDGLEVCHHCDNPLCVNPDHLYAGTHSQNMQDIISRGRANNRGDRNGRAKLSSEQIAEIRNRATGRYGEISQLAREYGVASGTMSKILKHQTWQARSRHSSSP